MKSKTSVCVISGASRGLGRTIAEHLATTRSSLALCARGADDLASFADELRSAHDVEVFARAVDVADCDAVAEFAQLTEEHLGPADALINNAGQLGPVGRIDTVSLSDWKTAFDTNVMGVVHMTSSFVPQMTTLGRGTIVNLLGGGVGGSGVQSFISAYTSAKGAIAVLTETTAHELKALGIRVNALSPGAVTTELMRPVLDAGPNIAGDALYETATAIYSKDGPEPSLAPATAEVLDYLLSDRSAGMTGRLLSARWDPVDQLERRAHRMVGSSLYTLRRIDGELFGQLDDR